MSAENSLSTVNTQVENNITNVDERTKDVLTETSAVEEKFNSKEISDNSSSNFIENTSLTHVEEIDTSAAKCNEELEADCERLVFKIIKLGYKREDAETALKSSHNDFDKAIQYLNNHNINAEIGPKKRKEIKPKKKIQSLENESKKKLLNDPEDTLSSEVPAIEELPNDIPAAEEIFDAGPLSFLRTQSEFQMLKLAINQNPRLMNVVLQRISLSLPDLFQLISENLELFFKLLAEPVLCEENSCSSKDDDDETIIDSDQPLELSPDLKKVKVSCEQKDVTEQLTTAPDILEKSGD